MLLLVLPLLLAQTLCFAKNLNTPSWCAQNTKQCNTHFTKQVYATTKPLFDRNMTKTLFPQIVNQGDDNHTCGVGSKMLLTDSCTQIHQPYIPYHPVYTMNVSYVESQVSYKWENVMNPNTDHKYDTFFDNSVAYFVDDLGPYYTHWKSLINKGIDIDMIFLRWYADFDVNNVHPYYSIITHNSNGIDSTLSTFELISDIFIIGDDINIDFIDSESRAYFDEYTDYHALLMGCDMFPIGSRRSVSNLNANVDWYKLIFSSTIIDESQIILGEKIDYRGNIVKYAHIKIEKDFVASATVSFFERNIDSTIGELKIQEFEEAMLKSHEISMVSPFCGIDRWFDNHYALSLTYTDDTLNTLKNIMLSGYRYTVFSGPVDTTYLYMPEPSGQSVQLLIEHSDIRFYEKLSFWNPEWCPMNCTNNMINYKFGERIFTENPYKNDNNQNENNKSISIVMITLVSGLLLIISIVGVVRYRRDTIQGGKKSLGYENMMKILNRVQRY